jgi:hypothetical protein
VSDEPRTFDLRLWVSDPAALEAFFHDVLELAERFYVGRVEARWHTERTWHGRPRVRVHPQPPFDNRNAARG